jgi:hypothetical protein
MAMVLRVKVTCAASRDWKLWTGGPSSVCLVAALRRVALERRGGRRSKFVRRPPGRAGGRRTRSARAPGACAIRDHRRPCTAAREDGPDQAGGDSHRSTMSGGIRRRQSIPTHASVPPCSRPSRTSPLGGPKKRPSSTDTARDGRTNMRARTQEWPRRGPSQRISRNRRTR